MDPTENKTVDLATETTSKMAEQQGLSLLTANPGILLGGCGCLLVLMVVALFAMGLFAMTHPDSFEKSSNYSANLSTKVPENFAKIFSAAEEKTGVPAAMIAARYLTEHHTGSFGKDLPSVDYVLSPCHENGSTAAGPMQFIRSSWNGVVDNLEKAGIDSPDRCSYHDSIIGAGFLLKGKFKFGWVQEVCDLDKNGDYKMTDECISRWGQAYCGINGCHDDNCGAPQYLYCEEVVRKYHIVIGDA